MSTEKTKASANANGNANGHANGHASAEAVTVFVAGGTSNTGSATIESLLKHHPHAIVRAGVRDLKKAAQKFPAAASASSGDAKQRLTFVVHDVKAGHLTAAASDSADAAELKGVDALLIVPPQSFHDRRGVSTAYIKAAKTAGVKHIVLITTTAVSNPKLYLTKEMVEIEAEVVASGVAYSLLRPGGFYENHWGDKATIAPADGSAAIYAPIAADIPFAKIAVKDIGEAAANALARAAYGPGGAAKKYGSRAYNLGGPALTHTELVSVYSRVLNKPVKFVSVPDAAYIQTLVTHAHFPPASANGVVELYRYYESEGKAVAAKGAEAAAAAYDTSELSLLLNDNRPPTTFAEWLVLSGAAVAFGGVKQTVFVAGGAGNTGSATIKSLLRNHPHVTIRAGVRDAKKAETVFATELADAALKARLSFAIHDVKNAHLTAAASDAADAAELKGVDTLVISPPAIATERVSVAKAYSAAAKAAGVKHTVIITTPAVSLPLILSKSLADAESAVTSAGVPHTFVRPVFFYSNYANNSADTIKAGNAWYSPAAPNKPIAHVAFEDIGEATANVAAFGSNPSAQHYGKAYAIASHNLTGEAQAQAFSKVLGRAISYVGVTDEAAHKAITGKGLPDFVAKGLIELFRTAEAGQWGDGNAAVATLQSLLNERRAPTSLESWVKANAKLFTA